MLVVSVGRPPISRGLSRTGVVFTSVGSIIGSGWLFGASHGAQVAGPAAGFVVAAGLLLLFAAVNVLGVRWFARINTPLVWWKLVVTVLVVVVLLAVSFDGGNFTRFDGFAPYGVDALFLAVASAGIVSSYLGFRQAVELSARGGTRNATCRSRSSRRS